MKYISGQDVESGDIFEYRGGVYRVVVESYNMEFSHGLIKAVLIMLCGEAVVCDGFSFFNQSDSLILVNRSFKPQQLSMFTEEWM